jgi:flavin reductase (DIM6/NTAB) family NADH-FMN oxidoreductase RutF
VHSVIDPAILYFGTPVVLVSSVNPDGSPTLAPMSSAWWLGRSCLLGFGARSHTPANIQRTGECVLNLPSVAQVAAVNRLEVRVLQCMWMTPFASPVIRIGSIQSVGARSS